MTNQQERDEFEKWAESNHLDYAERRAMIVGWMARAALKPQWSKEPPKTEGDWWWYAEGLSKPRLIHAKREAVDSCEIIFWTGVAGNHVYFTHEINGLWTPVVTPEVGE